MIACFLICQNKLLDKMKSNYTDFEIFMHAFMFIGY